MDLVRLFHGLAAIALLALPGCTGKPPGPYGRVGDWLGIPQLEQQVYDNEVELYGKRAVYACRSRLSPGTARYHYCLGLESGAVN